MDLRRVQEHMRHRNIQTTLRYAHLAPEHMSNALAALDGAVSNCHSNDTLTVDGRETTTRISC